MEFHEYAGIYDLLEGAEFEALVADIKANGLRLPIILHTDGRILDGRNRYRACAAAGVEPRYEQWDGVGLACDFVRSLNHSRRHLTVKQTQFSAARYAVLREEEAVARGRACLSKLERARGCRVTNDKEKCHQMVQT